MACRRALVRPDARARTVAHLAPGGGVAEQSLDRRGELAEALLARAETLHPASADLPEEMKKMTVEERQAYLAKKTAERAEIQKKVLTLNKEREAYVASQRKESAKNDTLDTAMVKALRTQAEKKGIAWEK